MTQDRVTVRVLARWYGLEGGFGRHLPGADYKETVQRMFSNRYNYRSLVEFFYLCYKRCNQRAQGVSAC